MWLRRSGSLLGGLLIFAVLHFASHYLGIARGFSTPRILTASSGGLLAGAALGVLLIVMGRLLMGVLPARSAVSAVCLGLVFWAMPGGTMDDWLSMMNTLPGPGRSGPYLGLLAEYGLWILIFGVLLQQADFLRVKSPATRDPLAAGTPAIFGAAACGITCVVLLAALWALMGPTPSETRRGQVYFVVFLGAFGGTFFGRAATHVRSPLPYMLAVPLAGIAGLLLAAARPVLAAPYQNLNNIPVWGPAHPLPIELMAVGILGVLWAGRSMGREPSHADAERGK